MKTLKYIGILLFTTLASCNYLEIDDSNMIKKDLIGDNPSRVDQLWAATYNALPNEYNTLGLSIACDEAESNNPFNNYQIYNVGGWNEFNNPDDEWASTYEAIRKCNLFFQLTDTITYKRYEITDPVQYQVYISNLTSYRLEVRFLRAFYHFELMKRYGNIPIVDSLLTQEDAKKIKRSSYTECISFIASECNAIVASLPLKWEDAQIGRITKGTVLALKSRLFLYAASPLFVNQPDTYDLSYCDSTINAAGALIKLNQYNLNIAYPDVFTKADVNSEIILDRRVANNNTQEFANYPLSGNPAYVVKVGTNGINPSQNLVDAYGRKSAATGTDPYNGLDPRLEFTVLVNNRTYNESVVSAWKGGIDGIGNKNATATGYYLKKYLTEKLNLKNNNVASHVWHIFRYAEVLLNYAEAANEKYGPDVVPVGQTLSALAAINQIRDRVGVKMPLYAAGISKVDFREMIRNERRVELAFEGHRFWDVRRWLIAEQTENAPLMGMEITKDDANNFTYTKITVENRKFIAPTMYRYPIPYSDWALYDFLEQTPGWNSTK